jgi:hypothetical protein
LHREVYRAGEAVASNKYTAHLKSTVDKYGNLNRERYNHAAALRNFKKVKLKNLPFGN